MNAFETTRDRGYVVIDHPILAHNLTILRDKNTRPPAFRRILGEMGRFLAYEATRDLKLGKVAIETPMEKIADAPMIEDGLIVVSIMRAGNGMLDEVMQILPTAQVGHIGIYRDKFIHNTVEYFFRIPQTAQGKKVLLLDPLLATGDTAVSAIQRLKEYGVGEIRLVNILAAPEGIEKLHKHHPDVLIYTASVEKSLNANGYILPGLGDAGDRLYGTL